MRAMKKTVSLLLALVMVLGMMTMAISVSAAETNTVTAKSNIADDFVINYTADSTQVTVTYNFKTATPIVNVEGYITYDSSVLKLNKAEFPAFSAGLVSNTGLTNEIAFNASNEASYDFSAGDVLANLVFDIVGTGATTVNLDVAQMTGTTSSNPASATSDYDVDVITGSTKTGNVAFTATANETVDGAEEFNYKDFFYGRNLSLEGNIGINYFFKLPDAYKDRTLVAKFDGPQGAFDVNFKDMKPNGNYLVATYTVCAKMMADELTMTITVDGTAIYTDHYSVMKYAQSNTVKNNTQGLKELMYTMLNYGAASQIQFKYETDKLANAEISYELQPLTADQVSAPDLVKPNLTSLGMTYYGRNLTLETDTSINVFLTINDKTLADKATATVNGKSVALTNNGNYKQITIPNIASKDLDETNVVTFSNGETFNISVLTVVKSVLASATQTESYKTLCRAIYWYNDAANTYFANRG